MASFAPDFGLYLQKQGFRGQFCFMPFRLHNLASLPEGGFMTMANTGFFGEIYAVSLEIDLGMLSHLKELLLPEYQRCIEEHLDQVKRPWVITFMPPVSLIVDARLGELQTNDSEEYVAFIMEKVAPLHA